MDISGIISISGKPGLYKVLARSKGGLLIESLLDGKKMPAHATNKISALEDISMYTYEEEIPLKEIFKLVFEKQGGKETVSPKSSNKELEEYFTTILPDYDKERVYASDIKKMLTWYKVLLKNGNLEAPDPSAEELAKAEKNTEAIKEDKPQKTASKQTTAKPKAAAKQKVTAKATKSK
jgi:hypothetical protein